MARQTSPRCTRFVLALGLTAALFCGLAGPVARGTNFVPAAARVGRSQFDVLAAVRPTAAVMALDLAFRQSSSPASASSTPSSLDSIPIGEYFIPQPSDIGFGIAAFWVAVSIASALGGSSASSAPAVEEKNPQRRFLASIKGSYSLLSNRTDAASSPELRWGVGGKMAEEVRRTNRADVEGAGFWQKFLPALERDSAICNQITFRDSATGKPLFIAPKGRTWGEFIKDCQKKGRLAFRDQEVVKQNVRVIGETSMVSIDGTHLGTNEEDAGGNHYLISISSVAGQPSVSRPSTIDLEDADAADFEDADAVLI